MVSGRAQGPEPPRFRTTAWPPGLELPEPGLQPWSRAVEIGGRREIRPDFTLDDPSTLPPDFAVREVLAVDPDVEDDVWKWSNAYGAPAHPGEERRAWSMAEQADVIRGAQQAAVFVLADLVDDPEAPEPYNTRAYLDQPYPDVWRNPAHEASAWLAPRLRHWAPQMFVDPVQADVEVNYAAWDEIAAVQLYNLVANRPTVQRCDNAPWHGSAESPWFTVQRTTRRKGNGYGPHRAGVRFCSHRCQKAHSERERRRRLRDTKENG